MANSRGVPHILEHSVLCGSRKYAIKVRLGHEQEAHASSGCMPATECQQAIVVAARQRTDAAHVCAFIVASPYNASSGWAAVPNSHLADCAPRGPLSTRPSRHPPHPCCPQEPFVELMKGSLNTFLNAFTYPDRTCYPVRAGRPLERACWALPSMHGGSPCVQATSLLRRAAASLIRMSCACCAGLLHLLVRMYFRVHFRVTFEPCRP